MPKSRRVIPKPKKGGRPATGRDPVRTMRLSDKFIASVDAWAADQPDLPARSEAIRRLVELGLAGKTKRKPPRDALVADLAAETIDPLPRSAPAARAKELAKNAIDKMTDATAPP